MMKAGSVGRYKHSELDKAMYTSVKLYECTPVEYKWNFGLHPPMRDCRRLAQNEVAEKVPV